MKIDLIDLIEYINQRIKIILINIAENSNFAPLGEIQNLVI